MISIMKNPLSRGDTLARLDPVRTITPLKSALLTNSSDFPSVLSTPAVHRRRPEKHVRFALTLEPVYEDSIPTSHENSPPVSSKFNKKVNEPWPQSRPPYGAYIDYLKKQDALQSTDTHIHHTSSPPPPPPQLPPEPQSPTYTHTFVIKSKSPTIVIDSITVSTPPLHLPQIIHRTKKSSKQQSTTIDSYVNPPVTLTTPPRIIHTKKLSNSTNQKNNYVSIHTVPKRSEINIPFASRLHSNHKTMRVDNNPIESKTIKDHFPPKKLTEIVSKPLSNVTNRLTHLPIRSNLSRYLRKPRIPSRTHRTNDDFITKSQYSFQDDE